VCVCVCMRACRCRCRYRSGAQTHASRSAQCRERVCLAVVPVLRRWEKKPETKRLDQLVHDAYTTPVGHWKFFHSRSTSNSAPPHAPPCGREAPQGRTDRREHVVARSVEEGIRVLETHHCRDLDFTNHAVMSHKVSMCRAQSLLSAGHLQASSSCLSRRGLHGTSFPLHHLIMQCPLPLRCL
jgi:hypothetical protein